MVKLQLNVETTIMPGLATVALPPPISIMGVNNTHQAVGLLGDVAPFRSDRIITSARRAFFVLKKKKLGSIWGLNGWMTRLVGGAKRTYGSI